MSLLNDMLNDLESRNSKSNNSKSRNSEGHHLYASWLPYCILLFGFALLTSYFYLQVSSSGKNQHHSDAVATSGSSLVNNVWQMSEAGVHIAKNELQPVFIYSEKVAEVFASALALAVEERLEMNPVTPAPQSSTARAVSDVPGDMVKVNVKANAPESLPVEQRMYIARSPESIDRNTAERALTLIAKRQGRDAEGLLLQQIETQAQSMLSIQVLADYYYDTAAMEKLADLSANTPFNEASLRSYVLARHYALRGENSTALSILLTQRAHPLLEEKYLTLQAGLSQKTGAYEAAEHLYEGLLSKRSNNPMLWLGYALASDANNKPEKALRAFKNVLHLQPANTQIVEYAQRRIQALAGQKSDVVASSWE